MLNVKVLDLGFYFLKEEAILQKSALICILILFISRPVFAADDGIMISAEKQVKVENSHAFYIAWRDGEDSLYLSRIQAFIDRELTPSGQNIRFAPFVEYQHNLGEDYWWRKEAGVEVGTFFFEKCLYWGASFQHVWQQEGNYPVESLKETSEWESLLMIRPPIKWGIFQNQLKLLIFDEYTYDFKRGQTTFNVVGVTLEWQPLEWLKVPVGWRHVDRVHDFDNDMLTLSLCLQF